MTIEKKTLIEQIEIKRDGTIQLRFGLLLVENGVEIDCKWHRAIVPPGIDVQETVDAVNADLSRRNLAAVDAAEVARVKVIVPVVQTPDVILKYQVQQAVSHANVEALKQAAVPPKKH